MIEFLKKKGHTDLYYFAFTERDKNYKGKVQTLLKKPVKDLVYICLHDNPDYDQALVKINMVSSQPNLIFVETFEDAHFDFKEFITSVYLLFDPQYGFVYKGVLGKMTNAYAFGQTGGAKYIKDISKKKPEDFRKWMENKLKFREGIIRDVYRKNFLNAAQVHNVCKNGQSLLQVIEGDPGFGSIEKMYDERYFWCVDEARLEQVRAALGGESFIR
jgi:hypothetical protein